MQQPLISVCIPAYKRTHFLKRLFDSIKGQTYKNIEVVVTDDSNTKEVAELCESYQSAFLLRYFKNPVQLGAAANWNRCLEMGNGEWLKIMHDDDWFASDDALTQFANATHSNMKFIWCNYFIKNDNTQEIINKKKNSSTVLKNIRNPFLLFGENIIGPPSSVMVHKSVHVKYDVNMTWLVDVDYYINILLQEKNAVYIPAPLIYFSHNDVQLTNIHFNNKATEIKESLLLWQKHGSRMISGFMNYDAWWRMIRNLNIRSVEEFKRYAVELEIPAFIYSIINLQKKVPNKLLKNPILSKTLMLFHYSFNYPKNAASR